MTVSPGFMNSRSAKRKQNKRGDKRVRLAKEGLTLKRKKKGKPKTTRS